MCEKGDKRDAHKKTKTKSRTRKENQTTVRNNHIMDWDAAKIIGSEPHKHRQWVKEAIEVGKRAKNTMKRDEGAFILTQTWDSLCTRWQEADLSDPPGWPRLVTSADKTNTTQPSAHS